MELYHPYLKTNDSNLHLHLQIHRRANGGVAEREELTRGRLAKTVNFFDILRLTGLPKNGHVCSQPELSTVGLRKDVNGFLVRRRGDLRCLASFSVET